MPIRSTSTIQAQQVLDGTHYLQVYNGSGGPILIFDIEGECSSTTGNNYYIQLLNTNAPVSGTTIPLYSRLAVPQSAATGVNGFSFIYRPIGLDTSTMTNPVGGTNAFDGSDTYSIYVAISSTDNVYTSVAASTNVTVDFEDTYLEIPTQNITGDTVTGVDTLEVWHDPGANHKILQLQYSNSVASTVSPLYLQLFPGPPQAGQVPLQEWTVTGTALTYIRFGSGFIVMGQGKAINTNGVITIADYNLHTGCYFKGSSTPGYLTATNASQWTMQAWYL